MKTIILLLACSFLPALARAELREGTFAVSHEVGFLNYKNAKACQKDGGRWQGGGVCLLEASDFAKIVPANGGYTVEVNTIGTNGRTCEFAGSAVALNERALVASMAVEQWIEGRDGAEGSYVPSECSLELSFSGADSLNVVAVNEAKCQQLCAGGSLKFTIKNAQRVRE